MAKILAEGRGLSKTFPARGQGKGAVLHGVSQVDLVVYEGETLGPGWGVRVGKSTLGRLLLACCPPPRGRCFFDGQDLGGCFPPDPAGPCGGRCRGSFQDTAALPEPPATVEASWQSPAGPLPLPPAGDSRPGGGAADQVGCPRDLLGPIPTPMSGGQRPRVGIASGPGPIPPAGVCAEPVSPWMCRCRPMLNLQADLQAARG